MLKITTDILMIMVTMSKKKKTGDIIPKKPRKLHPALQANVDRVKRGEKLPGGGRPKGSRTVFAETFLKAFIADFNEHGTDAIETVRREKPADYIKVAASLLPKDFNINMTNEAELEKFLEQFDPAELNDFISGTIALGAARRSKDKQAPGTRRQSDIVH